MKLWTGRFSKGVHPTLDAINRSIDFDIRLWRQDVATNRAHAAMLAKIGLLTDEELAQIEGALSTLEREFESGAFTVTAGDEDIHTAVERRVTELVGDPGRKLHTGRSRNDQVATDFRLFTLEAVGAIQSDILELCSAIVSLAEKHHETALPAYTHLQRGQPTVLAHHLLAYLEMFRRDYDRLADSVRRTAISPLGSGACVGSSLPLDREMTASALGFSGVSRNSLDAVSDRDFVLETLAALSITATHLSRLGEEFVVWSSKEFDFIRLGDDVATGSSMMPQKKNPDGAELIRGKAGRVFGGLVTLLTSMKGIPLAYNKDMQEDKEVLFDAVDTIRLCTQMATVMMGSIEVNSESMRAAIDPAVLATDLAEMLVARGTPLRVAHETVGKLVKVAEVKGVPLTKLQASDLEGVELPIPFDATILSALSIDASIGAKEITGATGPNAVRRALSQARTWLASTSSDT
ncbi:MAG: argininosuccinate lyase [Myxococcales bacterium]|nr:argininosuccinate lyase [Myxococcales bacterium]